MDIEVSVCIDEEIAYWYRFRALAVSSHAPALRQFGILLVSVL